MSANSQSPVLYAKPEILDALPSSGPAVIEASAGTGKTYTIEHLLVELVLRGTPIAEILVVTFTDKATTELRTRVREKLAELIALTPATAKPVRPGAPHWALDDRARGLLAAALRDFDAATISTIHAFCQRVLTENAFENQRLFAETQVDGYEAFDAAFKEVLRTELAREPAPRELLQAFLESGRSLDDLESLLDACNREPSQLRPRLDPERLDRALDEFPDDPGVLETVLAELERAKVHGSTRKAAMKRLQAIQAAALDARAAEGTARRLLALAPAVGPEELDYLTAKLGGVPGAPQLEALLARVIELGEAAVSLEAAVASDFLPRIRARLAQRKQQRGQFDFQDMLALVRDSLEGPHGGAVVELLRARYRYALIDEFQDTDPVQWDIFKRVFFDSDAAHGLFLIGDPKQAIYKFRGADVVTYLEARRAVVEKTARAPAALSDNFRSTARLIAAYNRILDDDAAPPFFTGPIRYDHPVRCGNPALALVVPTADGGGGDPAAAVHVIHLRTQESKAKQVLLPALGECIAREVKAITDPARLLFHDGKALRPLTYRDVYVLTRAREDGEAIGEALRRAGVPHAFYKQEGLFQTEEAENLLDLLLAVADPDDRSRRFRAWLTPFFALRLEDLAGAAELPGDHALIARLRSWKADADQGRWERLFARIVEESGIVRRQILLEPGERGLTNYLHLFELLLEQFGRAGKSLSDMIAGLRAFRSGQRKPPGESGNMQRLETERDAVQILTMHMSKGLEAPVVFLAGGTGAGRRDDLHVFHDAATNERCAWVGKLPAAIKAQVDAESAWEDERLLYVALTRAKARLYLPYLGTLGALDPDGGDAGPPITDQLGGCYGKVNARLAAILADPAATLGGGDGAEPPLFSIESVDGAARSSASAAAGDPAARAPAEGGAAARDVAHAALAAAAGALDDIPEALLAEPDGSPFYGLRARHAGYTVTSYTRMQPGHAPVRRAAAAGEDVEEFQGEVAEEHAQPNPDELPGGTETGVFLHEVLAALPPAWIAEAPDLETFAARDEVARLFARFAARHGVASRHLPHATRLVWSALRGPVRAGDRVIDGLHCVAHPLREMEFFFPIPESDHPLLGRTRPSPSPSRGPSDAAGEGAARPFEIHRGLVKGYMDLLFEHEGLAYFADWKSNSLRRFDADALRAEVEQSYRLQAKLYTLALVRMLRLRDEAEYEARFGGLLYLFLRGMRPDGDGREGVHFERPSWSDVVGWQRELLERSSFGGGAA